MSIKRVRSTIASTVSRLGLDFLNASGKEVYASILINTALPATVKVHGLVCTYAHRRRRKLQERADYWRACAFQLDCDHEYGQRVLTQAKHVKALDTTLASARAAKARVRAAECSLAAARADHKTATKACSGAVRAAQA